MFSNYQTKQRKNSLNTKLLNKNLNFKPSSLQKKKSDL